MKRITLLSLILLLIIAVTGCSDSADGGAGDPVQTVEQYMQAKVDSDATTIQALLCSEMESVLERETRTFDSVNGVEIDGMTCTYDGGEKVSCDGRIVALYGTEENEFPLTNYRVVQEDGEWKWCGETE